MIDDCDPDLHHEDLEPATPERVESDLDEDDESPAILLASSEFAAQILTLKIENESQIEGDVR